MSLINIFEKCMEVYQTPVDKLSNVGRYQTDEFDELVETSAAVITSVCNPDHILGSLSSLVFLIVPLDGSEEGSATMSKQYSEATITAAQNVVRQIHLRTMAALAPTIRSISEKRDHALKLKKRPVMQLVFEIIAYIMFGSSESL